MLKHWKLAALLVLLGALSARSQVKTVLVSDFAGATLSDKVTAAQVGCTPAAPCVIVFSAGLPKHIGESLPVQCADCTWVDYRVGQKVPAAALAVTTPVGQYVKDDGTWATPAAGGIPAGAVLLIVTGSCSATLGTGWAEETTLSGKFVLGTVAANADIAGLAGVDNITPAGTVSQPTFTGNILAGHTHTFTGSAFTPAGTIAWPVGVPAFTGSTFTPAGTIAWPAGVPAFTGSALATHTHTFTGSALATHQHELPFYKVAGGTGAWRMIPGSVFGTGTSRAAESTIATTANTTSAAVARDQAITAGTPAGTNAAITAGTPAGTNAWPAGVPTFTGTGGTPAGANAWPAGVPAFTGTGGTPAGTNSSDSGGTPGGTVSQPTFTGTSFDNRPASVKVIFCRKT